MKNCTVIILTLTCLVVQHASSMPDKAQDMMDRVKAKAQEAFEQAQETASRAMESAKEALNEAMEAAQQAKEHGIEKGQEWIEYGKSVAASFSNHTMQEKQGKAEEQVE